MLCPNARTGENMRVLSVPVSTRTEKQAGGGLSVTTLVIASLSSIAAALVIHKFWKGGAILGAGLTPVIVAIVSESLKKPTQAITAIREERRSRSTVARSTPDGVPAAPPPELERADPFGIWQDEPRSRLHWVKGRPLKIAVATGLLAFAIAAFAVTGAELVFGGDGGQDRFTIVPGKQEHKSTTTDDTKTTTQPAQPAQTTQTVPAETAPIAPPETLPPVTTAPPTTPPATTTPPAPTTPAPAPAPTPEQPAPAPAPAPQG
jgi:hypothetical protein